MKTRTKILVVIAVVVLIVLLCVGQSLNITNKGSKLAEFYELHAEIIEIDNDVVLCSDTNGNVWSFFGADDWKIHDNVVLIMNACSTAIIYDDAIVNVNSDPFALS